MFNRRMMARNRLPKMCFDNMVNLPLVENTRLYRGDYVEISLDTGNATWHGLFKQYPSLIQNFIEHEGFLCIYTRFIHDEIAEVNGDCIYYHPVTAKPLDIKGLFTNIASDYLGTITLPRNSGSFCRIGLVDQSTTMEHLDKFDKHKIPVSKFKTLQPEDEVITSFWDFDRKEKPNEYFEE